MIFQFFQFSNYSFTDPTQPRCLLLPRSYQMHFKQCPLGRKVLNGSWKTKINNGIISKNCWCHHVKWHVHNIPFTIEIMCTTFQNYSVLFGMKAGGKLPQVGIPHHSDSQPEYGWNASTSSDAPGLAFFSQLPLNTN